MVMYVVERHPNGSSRTVPATDVFTHLNQSNIKVMLPAPSSCFLQQTQLRSVEVLFISLYYLLALFLLVLHFSCYDCHKTN